MTRNPAPWIFAMICLFALPHSAAAAEAVPTAARDEGCRNSTNSYDCREGGENGPSGGAIGASAPLLGDTLGSNPAALPVIPMPLGLEGSYSDRSFPNGKPKFSFSTVKGFDGFGFGIGSWGDGTFSAPDFPEHYLGTSAEKDYQEYERTAPSVLGLRIGTAILLPQGPFPKGIRFSLGGSAGLSRVKGDWSPQVGALVRIYFLGIGFSESFDRLSKSLPKARISVFSAGLDFGPIYLEYAYSVVKSSVNRTFANKYSLRIAHGAWITYGGFKAQKDHRGAPDEWVQAGIQRRLGRHLGIGYEYGRYRYSHSGILQFFF